MPFQQSTDQSETQGEPKGSGEQEGMVVPWDLGALRLLKQPLQEDGRIEVEVLATTKRANCPHGQRVSVKVHDTRPRRKCDIPRRGHRMVSGPSVRQAATAHKTLARAPRPASPQSPGELGGRGNEGGATSGANVAGRSCPGGTGQTPPELR